MVPEYVFSVLHQIELHNGTPPPGYVGGRTFGNYDVVLPSSGRYQEYDVHPFVPGKNRGAERLIRANDGSAWYTFDHYKTFIKLK